MNAVRPSFIVNGDVIPESEKVKYRGHIICSDSSDDEDHDEAKASSICSRECYFSKFPCVRSLLRIRYFVNVVLPCIHVTCGGTIRHRAFIS